MKHYFKPLIILKKLQRAWDFFFFFFYSHKSKLDALNPHYFIALVMRRGLGFAVGCVALLHNSPVSQKSEYRLIEYVKEFEEPTKIKVTISEIQAKEIISLLNLVPLRDNFFHNNIDWQTEQRIEKINNQKS